MTKLKTLARSSSSSKKSISTTASSVSIGLNQVMQLTSYNAILFTPQLKCLLQSTPANKFIRLESQQRFTTKSQSNISALLTLLMLNGCTTYLITKRKLSFVCLKMTISSCKKITNSTRVSLKHFTVLQFLRQLILKSYSQ